MQTCTHIHTCTRTRTSAHAHIYLSIYHEMTTHNSRNLFPSTLMVVMFVAFMEIQLGSSVNRLFASSNAKSLPVANMSAMLSGTEVKRLPCWREEKRRTNKKGNPPNMIDYESLFGHVNFTHFTYHNMPHIHTEGYTPSSSSQTPKSFSSLHGWTSEPTRPKQSGNFVIPAFIM